MRLYNILKKKSWISRDKVLWEREEIYILCDEYLGEKFRIGDKEMRGFVFTLNCFAIGNLSYYTVKFR